MRRWSALVAALAAIASAAAWTPAAAAAPCSAGGGVTVVVDFGALGGGAQVGCAPGDPASGLRALAGAGYGYTGVQSHPGMVCKINGQPAADPCRRPPPTTAYWSYWYATPGGSWTYSSAGGGYRDPAPGTVDGWAFGAGSPPGIAPPAAPAPPKPPAPKPPAATETAQPTQRPEPTSRGQAAGRPSTSAATATPTATSTASSPTTASATTAPATSSTATTTTTTAVLADVAPSAAEPAGGGPTGFVIGAGAVVLLGGLAVGAARRRAKADR
ncbi:hypothetical protein [Actinokineospora sp. NPDC004072]